jgi:hypothetical protein
MRPGASEAIASIPMLFLMIVAGILGAVVTTVAASLWLGVLGGILLGPVGGSVAAIGTAAAVALRRRAADRATRPVQLVTADE